MVMITKSAMNGTPTYKKILLKDVAVTSTLFSRGLSDLMVRGEVSEVVGAACAATRRVKRMIWASILRVVMVLVAGCGFWFELERRERDEGAYMERHCETFWLSLKRCIVKVALTHCIPFFLPCVHNAVQGPTCIRDLFP